MKRIFIMACAITWGVTVNAQTKIKDGAGASLPNPNAILELESSTKGLLLPRVVLDSTNSFAPMLAHVAGMTVYNTSTSGTASKAVAPGYYYNDGNQWVRLSGNEGWLLKGNTGTDPVINFLGTTDAQPLRFKVNNEYSGYIGFESLPGYGGQDLNTTFGYKAGGDVLARMQTSQNYRKNTAFGYMALGSGTGTGITENTVVGYQAGNALAGTSTRNTFVGGVAGASMSEGSRNTGVGQGAMFFSTGGEQNVAMGWSAGANSGIGNGNVYIGSLSGSNGSGSGNIMLGYNSGLNYTGSNRLMIDNSGTNTPIIDGDLAGRIVTINNTIRVADLAGTGIRSVVADASGQLKTVSALTANIKTGTTLADTDNTVLATGNISVPAPSAANIGKIYSLVYQSGSVNITGSLSLGGIAIGSYGLNNSAGGYGITIQSNGSVWVIISRF